VEDVASALENPRAAGLPEPLVDPALIRPGGPPPDGIPALDEPSFSPAGAVDWLDVQEPVLSLTVGGQTRAYPVQVLIWHEIVNDTIGGVPVAVTYCPLCNTAIAVERDVAGRVLTFGTSGKLYNSALVMYDRQTRSLWPQFESSAVAGALTGTKLKTLPVQTISWRDWRAAHPDGLVLDRNTGHQRDYGANPYTGYDEPDEQPFAFAGDTDTRLAPKARIVAFEPGEAVGPLAVTYERLRRDRVVRVREGAQPVTVWFKPGLNSALDTAQIADGKQVGAVEAYVPVWQDRALTFRPDGDEFVDPQTGSTWDILGRAVAGPAAGAQLTPVTHTDTFWFAWAAFHPDTEIVR
jgi:hypothetical protein